MSYDATDAAAVRALAGLRYVTASSTRFQVLAFLVFANGEAFDTDGVAERTGLPRAPVAATLSALARSEHIKRGVVRAFVSRNKTFEKSRRWWWWEPNNTRKAT